jgi:hypothetical protein
VIVLFKVRGNPESLYYRPLSESEPLAMNYYVGIMICVACAISYVMQQHEKCWENLCH